MFVAISGSECDAVSSDGICYSYFSGSNINWNSARSKCIAWGGDLATVKSYDDNSLMYNTAPAGSSCWIGLNDIASENTFVWADGSTSTYRLWGGSEPNNYGNEDCTHTFYSKYWNDLPCTRGLSCYFCSAPR